MSSHNGTRGIPFARGELTANKRERRLKERAYENRFGIYRPATELSERALGSFALSASELGERYLSQVKSISAPLFTSNDGHAVTIVPLRVVRRRIAQGLRNGFEMHRVISKLENQLTEYPVPLSVKGMSWLAITPEMRKDKRHLVLEFEDTEEKAKIEEQYAYIEEILAKEGLYDIVNNPLNMHMTVLRYGHAGDHLSLSKNHSANVLEKIESYRQDIGLTEVSLEPIIIGPTYHKPHPELERRMGGFATERIFQE